MPLGWAGTAASVSSATSEGIAGPDLFRKHLSAMVLPDQMKLQGVMIADETVYDAAVRAMGGKRPPSDFTLLHPYVPGLVLSWGVGGLGAQPEGPPPTLSGSIPIAGAGERG